MRRKSRGALFSIVSPSFSKLMSFIPWLTSERPTRPSQRSSWLTTHLRRSTETPEGACPAARHQHLREFRLEARRPEVHFPLLVVLNDAIIFDPSLLEYVRCWLHLPGWGSSGAGLVRSPHVGEAPVAIHVCERPNGFGIAMLMHREHYVPVPEQMRIWYGDDWLLYRQLDRNFSLPSADIETEMSVTPGGFAASPIALSDAEAATAHWVFDGPFVR